MNAIQSLLTGQLDIWTTAETEKKSGRGRSGGNGVNVYGIKKLRELILELAVRGKLVPQDTNDEPAGELLKRIQAEKTKLIAEDKIKKDKPLPPISDEDKPFELPQGWEWVRLGNVAYSQAGFAFKSNEFNETGLGLPLIRIRDVGQVFTGTYFEGDYRDEFVVKRGDYLISMDGEFRVAKWLNGNALLNQRVSRLIFLGSETAQRFVAESLQVRLRELQGVKAYTTVDHLSGQQISNSVLALPPVSEQHRIVAKVDELMALCDQLETQHINAAEAHEKLVNHLLGTLTQSQSTDDFSANWQRIAAHFDTLFTTEASIDALKQTLFQLAVMGKLVPQDPNDEPASELLNRIQAEKARLVAEGKIKKDKPLPSISDEEKPFELPQGWKWVRLCEITSKITDGDHKTPPRILDGFRLLSAKNVRDGYLDLDNCDFISEQDYLKSRERCCPDTGNLLIVSVGGTIGRTSLVPDDSNFALVRSVALIKPLLLNSFYLKQAMDSDLLQESIHTRKRGGAQPCLYLSEIEQFVFSLPPFSEQHRIVAKVDELMILCDQLKSRITQASQLQQKLADVIVEQAIM